MSPQSARMAVVVAALLWSTGGVAIKLSSADAPMLAGGRALFAAVALFLIFPKARVRPNLEIIKTALAYGATCVLFVWANTLTTAGNAIFIQNIAPVWVLFAGPILLSERPSRAQIISLPISLAGCALFFADSLDATRTQGNAIAFCASFSYAALIMQYRKVSTNEGIAATLYGNLMVIAICMPLSNSLGQLTHIDWAVLAYLGLIQQALPAVIFVTAIRSIYALEGALLLLLEPLFSPIWAFLIVGERLGNLAILGAIMVLIAAAGRNLAENRSSAGFQAQNGG